MKVIFEDEDLLVLDKPSGITVNRSDTTMHGTTVQDYVDGLINLEIEDKESDFYKRCGIIHRIDKETSGILLVAKNRKSFENLQGQFKERKVQKSYLALVHGVPKPPEGEISTPLGRLPWNRKRFGVLAGGREAVTEYKVLEIRYLKSGKGREALSLIEARPKTGRTHQIRVHLKSINHPIFSDELYAGRKVARDDRKFLPRIFLHAEKITIRHPRSNKKISFETELPEDLKDFLNTKLERS
ncbi:MAG: RluA family pseudouridine synthase [Patescibacteria group bacterium]